MAPETTDIPDEPETPAEAAEQPPAAEPEAPAAAAPAAPPTPQLAPKERKAVARAQRGRRRGETPEERSEIRAQKAAARRRRRLQERQRRAATPSRAAEGTPVAEKPAGTPQVRLGTVVSDKADKTITVRIDIARRHRRYRKIVRSSMTLHAHDERNDAHAGDLVRVVESRPMSRTKRWRLVEVLERAK
jgi:small subunit ribosomal protein S17